MFFVLYAVLLLLFICFSVLFVARRNLYASHNFHGSKKHITMYMKSYYCFLYVFFCTYFLSSNLLLLPLPYGIPFALSIRG